MELQEIKKDSYLYIVGYSFGSQKEHKLYFNFMILYKCGVKNNLIRVFNQNFKVILNYL